MESCPKFAEYRPCQTAAIWRDDDKGSLGCKMRPTRFKRPNGITEMFEDVIQDNEVEALGGKRKYGINVSPCGQYVPLAKWGEHGFRKIAPEEPAPSQAPERKQEAATAAADVKNFCISSFAYASA